MILRVGFVKTVKVLRHGSAKTVVSASGGGDELAKVCFALELLSEPHFKYDDLHVLLCCSSVHALTFLRTPTFLFKPVNGVFRAGVFFHWALLFLFRRDKRICTL